jgi:hypothetical protein
MDISNQSDFHHAIAWLCVFVCQLPGGSLRDILPVEVNPTHLFWYGGGVEWLTCQPRYAARVPEAG